MKINGTTVKVLYEEPYKDDAVFEGIYFPELKHLTPGYRVIACQLLKAGRLADGNEFQEIRVVLKGD